MIATVVVITLFCLGVGIAVFRANPGRFANQVYAVTALFTAGWLACVVGSAWAGMRFGTDGVSSPLPWLRTNGAITAFMPWLIFILGDAVSGTYTRRQALLRSWPLIALAILAAVLCFTDYYLPSNSTPAQPARGLAYFGLCATGLVVDALLIVHTYRRMRQQTGLRRVEMTFLTLNLAIAFPLVIVVTAVGNALQLNWCRRSSLVIFLISFALSGWAMTFHRIYNARQIVVSLVQRLVVIVGLAASTWVAWWSLTKLIPSPADLCVAVAVCTPLALWFDARSRTWLDLNGERRLAAMRRAVIDLSRTEPSNAQLVEGFERLLANDCDVTFAALFVDRGDAFVRDRLELRKDSPAFACLIEHGWVTPETLDRRRSSPSSQALQRYLQQHSLGLLVPVPRGTPAPSLLIALGMKASGWPFTYPEVQRIQEIAGVVDNILVRSRLVAEEGLKAKVDHLSMMSRGLAHDLKNLITPISSFLVHTRGQYPEGSVEEEVHNAARRSVAIIGDYVSEALFFSKRLTPKFELIDLPRTLASVTEITATRAARRGVAVITALERRESFVADGVLVQRLLVNLTNNAIDASAGGTNVQVVVGHCRPGWVQLEVKDDGIGIPREHVQRIFEPYFTTKQFGDDVRGFGLGLTICDKIVALHHGTISVRSEVGVGTTVTVHLPEKQGGVPEPHDDTATRTRPASAVVPATHPPAT